MAIPYFEVMAFTDRLFSGNPAGVCLLPDGSEWPANALLQQIAAENNLAETAFLIRRAGGSHCVYDLRWMTPAVEVDLCGHATLASAHVLFEHLDCSEKAVRFQSKSGELTVERGEAGRLVLDFPSRPGTKVTDVPRNLIEGIGARPQTVLSGRDYICVFDTAAEVAAIQPKFDVIAGLDLQGVVVTAAGEQRECDFVSRYFAPAAGIPEDPVTGSVHCALIPYWSERLGKRSLMARQISTRGGELFCEHRGGRVGIGGRAVTYLQGKLCLP